MSESEINNNKINEILLGQSENNILQQYCKTVTSYQGMVIGSSKELALQIKDASTVVGNIDTKVQGVIEQLTGQINELRSEVLLLRSVAKNIPEYIIQETEKIIPKISSKIQQIYQNELQAIDDKIEEHNSSLTSMANKATTSIAQLKEVSCNSLDSLITKSKKIDRNYFKQLGLNIAVTTIISVIVGVSASYFMIQQFPTKVFVDNPNNITIDSSNVNILKKAATSKR